jgi:hypothetical protein
VPAHHLAYRAKVRRATCCGGDDFRDLREVSRAEDAGGGDREEACIGGVAVLESVISRKRRHFDHGRRDDGLWRFAQASLRLGVDSKPLPTYRPP